MVAEKTKERVAPAPRRVTVFKRKAGPFKPQPKRNPGENKNGK